MTTTYDRMREAAARLSYLEAQQGDGYCAQADELCADADRLESVEREMRATLIVDKWADRIRGEGK